MCFLDQPVGLGVGFVDKAEDSAYKQLSNPRPSAPFTHKPNNGYGSEA